MYIVGAGAAGNVLANRLTQNEKTSVLLVEASGESISNADVPGSSDSSYRMVPQKRAMREHPVRLYSLYSLPYLILRVSKSKCDRYLLMVIR